MSRNISRREMLRRAAVVGGASAVPASALGQVAGTTEPFEHLSGAEARTLEAIVGRLIPADENGPGAHEAGAARYIDRALGSALADSLEIYRAGLAAVDALARSSGGRAFAELDAELQDRVLADVERGIGQGFVPSAAMFFEVVRSHTIEGTFCDPAYGGNQDFIGWELIGYPGIRLAVAPADQAMAAAPAMNRVSAYDLPMFDSDAADDDPGSAEPSP